MKKHYDILGLSLDASSDEVKRAYRDLSKKYHPDLCVAISKERAEEKFKEINEAYGMIKNHLKKANNKDKIKEESTKNEKSKYDVEMIYDLVQKYIAETQLKASSIKFPSKDNLSFLETDSFLMIEGYFFSKNWIDQNIKTNYRISLFKNFKLDKLEFLKTEIIEKKEKDSTNSKKNSEINDKLNSYTEREVIYRWIRKYIMDMHEKPMSCDFPTMSTLNYYAENNKIVVEGFFSYPNSSRVKTKKEYKVYMNSQYIILKFQSIGEKSSSYGDDKYSQAYQRYSQDKKKKSKDSIVINLNFLKSKFLFLVLIVFMVVAFLIPLLNNDSRKIIVDSPKTLSNYSKLVSPTTISSDELYMRKSLAQLREKMDYTNPVTRKFYLQLASVSEGSYNLGQIISIYQYMRNNWKYVNDPKDREYMATASESINNNLIGDCDDFAVLIATCIRGIGGTPRIIFAEGSSSSHAYTEVLIAENETEGKKIINQLSNHINIKEDTLQTIHYRIDKTGRYWLNLDWTSNYPGGEYFQANREFIFDFRDLSYMKIENNKN